MKIALICAALVLAVPAVAAAETGTITRRETIRFEADAANTDAGAQRLYAHMQRAARRVCTTPTRSPVADRVDRDCAVKALDRAVFEAGAPRLTALHIKREDQAGVLLAQRED